MKTLEEYTEYLLNCDFMDEKFDPDGNELHLKASWELLDNYEWQNIYPILIHHLHTKCSSPADVINFANLYMYYEFAQLKIPEPIEFVSYLYYRVDMDTYWDEAGEMIESLSIEILKNHNLIDIMINPYYNPLNDQRILKQIASFKSNNIH